MGRQSIVNFLAGAGCRMPVEGVDIPVNEAEVQAEMQATMVESVDEWDEDKIAEHSSDEQEIIVYVNQRFGPTDALALRKIVPVLEDVYVAIHVIRPTGQHPFMTLFTTGMSSRAMNVPAGQEAYSFGELLMHLPMTWLHPRKQAPTTTRPFGRFRCCAKRHESPRHRHVNSDSLAPPYPQRRSALVWRRPANGERNAAQAVCSWILFLPQGAKVESSTLPQVQDANDA